MLLCWCCFCSPWCDRLFIILVKTIDDWKWNCGVCVCVCAKVIHFERLTLQLRSSCLCCLWSWYYFELNSFFRILSTSTSSFFNCFHCQMGLLTSGEPLSWNETQKYAEYVREHGIIQFINVYNRLRDRQDEFLKWGDEVRSYRILAFFPSKMRIKKSRWCLGLAMMCSYQRLFFLS